jgi:hypothetical protein
MTARLRLIAVALALGGLLNACGGGGGSSSGGGGGNTLSVRLNATSLSWTHFSSDIPVPKELTATISGSYPGTVYVLALVRTNDPVSGIDPNIFLSVSATAASAMISPAPGLAPGRYTGAIDFFACSDSACNNHIGGTPVSATFEVIVKRTVMSNPDPINVTAASGNETTLDVAVTLGEGESDYTIPTLPSDFVEVRNKTIAGFQLLFHSLPETSETTWLVLQGTLGSNHTTMIHYTVTPPVGGYRLLSVTPTQLDFTATEGTATAPQSVTVTPSSWKPGLAPFGVLYAQGDPGGWLSVVTTTDGYRLVADARNLSSGSYVAALVIAENNLPGSAFSLHPLTEHTGVNVAFTVGAGLVAQPDVSFEPTAETNPAALQGSATISLASGNPQVWAASSDASWLSVTAGGNTGGTLAYRVDPAWLATAQNFQTYVGTVTVTVPGTAMSPMRFHVRVTPKWPEVNGAGPPIAIANAPARVAVTGRGFNAIASLASRVHVSNATIASITRASDSKLVINLAALAANAHIISIDNAAGATTNTRTITARTPATRSYAAVAAPDFKLWVAVDDRRDAVYTLGMTDGALLRYRNTGSGWVVETVPETGVKQFVLLNDGSLLVSVGTATLKKLDGDSFATLSSATYNCLPPRGGGILAAQLPVANDDSVWLAHEARPTDCTTGGRPHLWRLNPADLSMAEYFDVNRNYIDLVSGYQGMNARDGERLLASAILGNALSGNNMLMDTSQGVWRQGSPFLDSLPSSLSDDGTRMVLRALIYDDSFTELGRLDVPAYGPQGESGYRMANILAPKGDRAYVFTALVSDLTRPDPQHKPRVYVFDLSAATVNGAFPVLGYFEVNDYPSCTTDTQLCGVTMPAAMDMAGATLFIAGRDRLLVIPIPGTLLPVAAAARSTGRSISSTHAAPEPVRMR